MPKQGIYLIYWIFAEHIGCIGYIVHKGTTPPVKPINRQRKRKRGGAGTVKIETLIANPMKSQGVNKKILDLTYNVI